MEFFDQQDRARASSKRLLWLLPAALVLTNLGVYAGVAMLLRGIYLLTRLSSHPGWLARVARHFCAESVWSWELLAWVTLGVTALVALVSGFKLWQLSQGGAVVAKLLGGRLVSPDTTDLAERRLLNVVEEMAIASGLPVPGVYVLEDEFGINALAAGNEPTDAVVAVTFGALKLLSRDELQAVVAHEFSHILNGDMRLNTRLIGWLHGLVALVVLGRVLTFLFVRPMAPTQDGRGFGPVFHPALLPAFVLGWICIVVGSLAAWGARLVQCAVNRQREYLADAAAVQFTRNPAGLAGALKKIGGLAGRSVITSARSELASHMYFSDGMRRRWFGLLATHPPLIQRIRRLDPSFDGKFPAVSLRRVLQESPVTALYRSQGTRPVDYEKLASVIGPEAAAREAIYAAAATQASSATPARSKPGHPTARSRPILNLEFAMTSLGGIPEPVRQATHQPASAAALIYAMLCSKEPDLQQRQIDGLIERTEPGIVAELQRLVPLVAQLDPGHFLPLADLAVRVLRQLSPEQYDSFCRNLQWLMESDREIDLFEYMLQRMIVRQLEPHFRPVKRPPVQYYTLEPLLPDCAVLLSGLARIGSQTEEEAKVAFAHGAKFLGAESALELLPLGKCNLLQIDGAINQVGQASAPLKQQILGALLCTAATDRQLGRREAELLRAVADAWGLAVPPFLTAAPDTPA